MQRLQKAFDECLPYKWKHYTDSKSDRDISIIIQPADEADPSKGVVAYYSSEFQNCGNGQYFLLLNPILAIHYEDD